MLSRITSAFSIRGLTNVKYIYCGTYNQIYLQNHYYTGSRLGQILHSRLRMQCSSLNQHLYRKNIVDSPNCICGSTQSTTHYLFHYLRYTAQRQMYINSINVPINRQFFFHFVKLNKFMFSSSIIKCFSACFHVKVIKWNESSASSDYSESF
jgi:hypothetical protein